MTDLVGLLDVARALHVQPDTARKWRTRRVLPEPLTTVSGIPLWSRSTIEAWAHRTGRADSGRPLTW